MHALQVLQSGGEGRSRGGGGGACDSENELGRVWGIAHKNKTKVTIGIVDSVRYLTADFTKENKILLNTILSPDT